MKMNKPLLRESCCSWMTQPKLWNPLLTLTPAVWRRGERQRETWDWDKDQSDVSPPTPPTSKGRGRREEICMNPFCSPRLAHLSTTCNLLRGLLLGTCGFLKAPPLLLPLRNGIRVAIRVGNRSNSGAARRFCINKSEENVAGGEGEGISRISTRFIGKLQEAKMLQYFSAGSSTAYVIRILSAL